MSDPFILLGLPRRPFLNEEQIGSAYRRLAGEFHPDQAGGDAVVFREIGEAAAILRDPARRLRELAGGAFGNPLPPQAADLFSGIASTLHCADELLEKHSAASNALAKALLIAPTKALAGELKATLSLLRRWRASLDQKLEQLDRQWPEANQEMMARLADSYAYEGRWETELRARELAFNAILS